MIIPILLLIVGLVFLLYGADWLVLGASSLARRMAVPTLVIGLTIVAFGTSMPEFVVNILSAINKTPDVAIGNIIGSNIANILLILGLSSLFGTLAVQKSTIRFEIPIAIAATLAILFMSLSGSSFTTTGTISRLDGLLLLLGFAGFLYYIYCLVKKGDAPLEDIALHSKQKTILYIIAGLLCLFVGGKLLVDNAVILARALGMSELFIGLTVVGVGTSLPELMTSVIAARKGQSDLAVGNIIGSNIFNILWILGITSVLIPLPVSPIARQDIFISLIITIILIVSTLYIGKRRHITWYEGIGMLILYAGYITYAVLR